MGMKYLRKKYKLQMFENEVLRKLFVTYEG
jgi:hypothetical protein